MVQVIALALVVVVTMVTRMATDAMVKVHQGIENQHEEVQQVGDQMGIYVRTMTEGKREGKNC